MVPCAGGRAMSDDFDAAKRVELCHHVKGAKEA